MTYTGLNLFMDNLMQIIRPNDNPFVNHPSILSQRPQLQLLYQELESVIQTLFVDQGQHNLVELEEVRDLKKRFKDAAEEAEYIIDLFVSAVVLQNKGLILTSDIFKSTLDLEDVRKSIKTIKEEFMATMDIDDMRIDSSQRTNSLDTASAARTSCTKNPLLEDFVEGLDDDAMVIVEKLAENRTQLCIISIVGMGGLGKTTLATKVYNDPYVEYYFDVRAWVTISQSRKKRDFLISILASIGVELVELEEANDFLLHQKLHHKLFRQRYLIVIDDIWTKEAWDELKPFFRDDNTGSRILLTSRQTDLALHAKPHGLTYPLKYMTEELSWKLLRRKVFRDKDCPSQLVETGKKIAKKCQGLPLALVVIAGLLAKEAISKDLWKEVAQSFLSFIKRDQSRYMETLTLSYYHLPHHLRECFLYLGGFPEDYNFSVRKLIWLWVAEGFIQEDGNQSLDEIAEAYLKDLVNRNLLIVAERKLNGSAKVFKIHNLMRELCLERAGHEGLFHIISGPWYSQHKQRRVFTKRDIFTVNIGPLHTPRIRSYLCFHRSSSSIYNIASHLRSFASLRVLDLQNCELSDLPEGIALLIHLRYLAVWYVSGCFPSFICNIWSLQTMILITRFSLTVPSKISDLVNLRHLSSNKDLVIPSIEKLMNLQTISLVELGNGIENFRKCFPDVRKASTYYTDEAYDFHLLDYLETLMLTGLIRRSWNSIGPEDEPYCWKNQIRLPASLKKLTLVRCHLPWSDMSIIQSLPNLEVLKLIDNAFVRSQWNAAKQQFQRLKFLRLEELNIRQWEAHKTNFPSLKQLQLVRCNYLGKISHEIGHFPVLELIALEFEKHNQNHSLVASVQLIQEDQHYAGNCELRITVNGENLSSY